MESWGRAKGCGRGGVGTLVRVAGRELQSAAISRNQPQSAAISVRVAGGELRVCRQGERRREAHARLEKVDEGQVAHASLGRDAHALGAAHAAP